MNNKKGLLILVSGFSGAGKGTITRKLLEKYPDEIALSISATTRAPRDGEENGVHYFFKTKEEFEEMIRNDEFIEYASYVENYYGTPKAYVEKCLNEGKDVILEIEVQGGLNIIEKYPDVLSFWITTKDAETLKKRLVGRGTEAMEVIEKRMKRAAEESKYISNYEFMIVNDDLDTAVEEFYQIVQDCRNKTCYKLDFVDKMKSELENI